MKKHVLFRSAFYLFIVLGLLFIGRGTVDVIASTIVLSDADGEAVHELRVVPRRWKWDPEVLVVPYGALVTININNEDTVDHGFAIREFGLDRRLPNGTETTVRFVADQEGEFEYYCSVYCGMGHFDQKGKIVVTRDDPEVVLARYRRAAADLPVRTAAERITRLPYTVAVDGAKEFELTAEPVLWDYGNGTVIESWGYNGQLPGPEIRVTEGDLVRITFTNHLPVATTVHWHGVDLPNAMDGVPGYTQDPVQPGESFVYEFNAHPAGTRFYHTHGSHHGDEALQMDMGLAGAFVIEPRDFDAPDVDYTMVLTERISEGAFPINGAIYPETEFIRVKEGDRVRVRMINAGSSTFHPMHLHGHQFRVVATDGNPVPEAAQLVRNTLPLLPGETYDVEFIADNPGVWLFHCHELQHAAGGMITAVLYEGALGGEYTLTDHVGETVSHEDFSRGYSLVSFGYTWCPDICPATMALKSAALNEVGDEVEARGLFFTIDPERDTPEVLAPYVEQFGNRMVGLTGSAEQVAHAARIFNIRYEAVAQSNGNYSMDHSSTIYLLGPGGEVLASFGHDTTPSRIAATVRQHLTGGDGRPASLEDRL